MAYSVDIAMIRLMAVKANYRKYINELTTAVVTDGTMCILKDFGKYYATFEEHERVDYGMLIPRMHAWNSKVTEEVMATRIISIKAAAKKGDLTEAEETALATEIANAKLSAQIDAANERYAEGEIDNLGFVIRDHLDAFKKNAGVMPEDWITTDIGTLLEEDNDLEGYVWRLQCLQDCMRGLRAGDFGLLAGRPDKGKTTFTASEVTALAPQIPAHRNVLWLNNEGPGRRIIPRIYQAALGLKRSEMVEMHQHGRLVPAYEEAVGRVDKIRVVDIHGMYVSKVESLIEAHNAEIVVFDMIDNIKGFGDAARTDLMLEQMYQWARECAVQHNFVGLATSQISADGDGEQFPTLPMLKDSKTGKQGAADFIITLGASNSPELQSLRYIGCTKNKLRREGRPGDPRATVQFAPEIARLVDSADFNEE